MFNANDSSMNDTCNAYVQYSAQKTETNLRIIQEYFQPKFGRKIRIFSLGWKNNMLIKKKKKKKSVVAFSSNYFHFLADAQLLFTKERHFQSSDFKMLQHGGYAESEKVNRTNKRQRR